MPLKVMVNDVSHQDHNDILYLETKRYRIFVYLDLLYLQFRNLRFDCKKILATLERFSMVQLFCMSFSLQVNTSVR